MKFLGFARSAFGSCAVGVLSACNASQLPANAPGAMQQQARIAPSSSSYQKLYSFRGWMHHDGAEPVAGLINVNGTMYGTTYFGGGGKCDFRSGCGTVFSITTTGKEHVLYRFGGGSDGEYPNVILTDVNDTLYGTAPSGFMGTGCYADCGTVFSITTSGAESTLYTFTGSSDGADPEGGLINVNGTFYGTTFEGGANDNGTVFSVTTSGTENVLYRFAGGSNGALPLAGLLNVKGTLYGTTASGGGGECANHYGCGTVFRITIDGTEKVLYRFVGDYSGRADGNSPEATLINVKGRLYGTTYVGGANDKGTVFSVTTAGKEKVLYSFAGGSDGALPTASLINVKGTLYGTTSRGGVNDKGTVFSVTTTGTEKVLYSLGGGSAGVYPYGGLVDVNGTLYGTTDNGGNNGCRHQGCGTVFALTP